MNTAQFREWKERNGLNIMGCARMLGLAENTVRSLDRGVRQPGRTVALACAAIDAGLHLPGSPAGYYLEDAQHEESSSLDP